MLEWRSIILSSWATVTVRLHAQIQFSWHCVHTMTWFSNSIARVPIMPTISNQSHLHSRNNLLVLLHTKISVDVHSESTVCEVCEPLRWLHNYAILSINLDNCLLVSTNRDAPETTSLSSVQSVFIYECVANCPTPSKLCSLVVNWPVDELSTMDVVLKLGQLLKPL